MSDLHEEYVLAGHPDRTELEKTMAVHRHLGAAPPDPGPLNYKSPPHLITAFIDPSACLGEGSVVWHFARVLGWARIGKNVSIGGGTEIGRGCVIGDHTRISANCFLPNKTVVGEAVFIGPNVVCCDDRMPKVLSPADPPYTAEPPVIEDHASIGANCTILPGVRIGAGARVAAGSIVTRDVPPFGVVLGAPARVHELSDASRDWVPAR